MPKDINKLFDDFITECRYSSRLSEVTLRGYQSAFDLLLKTFPDLTLEIVTARTITEFFKRLDQRKRIVGRGKMKKGIKNSTVASYWRKLKKFFDWLKTKGYLTDNPLDEMSCPAVNYDDVKYLKKEEVEKIFLSLNHYIEWNNIFVKKRNIALISLALNCGLRKGELLGLKLLNVEFDRKQITITADSSKSKKQRVLPLNQRALLDVKDYIEEYKKRSYSTPYFFASNNRDDRFTEHGLKHLIEKLKKVSRVDFHLHLFRHTFAVNMLNMGCDLAKLQQLMGHSDIRMTTKYLRCLPTKMMRVNVEMLTLDNLV